MAHIVSYILCIALTVALTSADDQQPTEYEEWQNIISEMTSQINSSCVSKGCPELKSPSLCPSIDDTTTLVAIINTANRCVTRPLCGLVMDPDVVPAVTFKLGRKPWFGHPGVCTLFKVGSFVNFSYVQMTDVSRTQNQVNISIFMPNLSTSGRISCDGGQINMSYSGLMTFNFTIVYNGNDVRVEDPKFTIINFAYHVRTPQKDVRQNITRFDPKVIASEEAMLAAILSPFMSNTYQSVFEVASQNCPELLHIGDE